MKKRLLTVALLSGLLLARAETVKAQGSADHADGLYELSAPITFTFTGLAKETEYPIALFGDQSVRKSFKMKSDAQGTMKIKTKLDRPGFVRCTVYDGKRKVSAGAGVQPDKVRGARKMPADFADFWKKQTDLLDQTPLKAELKALPDKGNFKTFDLTLPCPGSATPVRGYFSLKKDAAPKSSPAILTLHGAGVNSASPSLTFANKGYITLDINAHGIDNGKDKSFHLSGWK